MVISDEHRFLFVEVPHTASHSISQELCRQFGGRPILRKHANLSQFMRSATREERSYFKFATVRNPLDTALTHYMKLKTNHKGQYTNPKAFIENGGSVTAHHRAQFHFVHDEGNGFDRFFARYRNEIYNNWFLLGHRQLDFVIRFERLQDDYLEAMRRIGVKPDQGVPHVNPTKGRGREGTSFLDSYPAEIRAQVARCYGPFLEMWGYPLPESWTPNRAPFESRWKFKVKDAMVNFAARFVELDPDSPVVMRTRALVDTILR